MGRSSCTTAAGSWRIVGIAACLTTIALISSACARAKPNPTQDSPLFMGCQTMCAAQGRDISSVMETRGEVYCECVKKPPGPPS